MSDITAEKLIEAKLSDAVTSAKVADALAAACDQFDIDSGLRLAGFLSQCSHESAGFKVCQENLNYSASALVRVFPKHFDGPTAARLEHQPQAIANRVYADRMGNGPEASGDGWRFHGRGFIQLTGKDNYDLFGKALAEDVLSDPDSVAQPERAALSAAWFWARNGLNKLADAGDVVGMTKRINGGTLGLDDRKRLYTLACGIFC